MTNKKKTVVTPIVITTEIMGSIVEKLVLEEWFSREADGSMINSDGDKVEFEEVQRAVEQWFRVLVDEIVQDPDWHMHGRTGWPTLMSSLKCEKYWCRNKPIDGSHLCLSHLEEVKEEIAAEARLYGFQCPKCGIQSGHVTFDTGVVRTCCDGISMTLFEIPDYHAHVASRIHSKSVEDVTPEERNAAKNKNSAELYKGTITVEENDNGI